MHVVFAFSFGGHGSGRHLADGSLIIRGGLYASNEVSCNRGEFRVDVRHSELRLPRLRRKHGLRRQSIQVPGQVSTGLARNLGASPVRWFRQTIDKGDQSELISEERIHMKQTLLLVLVISAGVLLAQVLFETARKHQQSGIPFKTSLVYDLVYCCNRHTAVRESGNESNQPRGSFFPLDKCWARIKLGAYAGRGLGSCSALSARASERAFFFGMRIPLIFLSEDKQWKQRRAGMGPG
jgi:hypothetical protein